MCFSPKIKTPKVDTTKIPEPAPLTEQPEGVQFGGEDESNTGSEVSGRKSLKVAKTSEPNGSASKIRKSALGG